MSSVIDNKCRQASCKIQRTSKARDSYKQCSIPNKSQAMNSVLKGFICNLQLCQPKADLDPAINVIFLLWFIDTPNNPSNERHHSSWSGVSGATPVTCVTSSLRDGFQPPGSILNLPCIPKLGSSSIHLRPLYFTASAKCISQPSNDGMAWSAASFLKVSSWWEWESKSEERRANEPPINCEVVSILKKQAGRPFVIPCASWCEQKCVKIHRAIQVRVKCANFHSKKPLIRKVCDSRKKRPIQLSQNPFDGTLSHFKSCSRMWFP